MDFLNTLGLCWLAVISIIAVVLTVHDKKTAIYNGKSESKRRRTPEKTLFTVAALGGSAAMLGAMLAIRHKTQHKRFMIGLPAIMIAQLALAIGIKLLAQNFFPM